jgi:hypothetical protein
MARIGWVCCLATTSKGESDSNRKIGSGLDKAPTGEFSSGKTPWLGEEALLLKVGSYVANRKKFGNDGGCTREADNNPCTDSDVSNIELDNRTSIKQVKGIRILEKIRVIAMG